MDCYRGIMIVETLNSIQNDEAKCAKSNIETIISFPCKISLALHRYAACHLVIWCVKMTRVSTEVATSCVTVSSFVLCVCAHCLYEIIPWCCSLTAARWPYISTEWHFFYHIIWKHSVWCHWLWSSWLPPILWKQHSRDISWLHLNFVTMIGLRTKLLWSGSYM